MVVFFPSKHFEIYEWQRAATAQTRVPLRQSEWDFFVALLFIGDLIRFYLFLTKRTSATAVLNEFTIGNVSSIIWTGIAGSYLAYILLIGRCRAGLFFTASYLSISVLILVFLLSSAWSIVPTFSLYRSLELVVWAGLSIYFFTRLRSLINKVTFLAVYCVIWVLLNIPIFFEAISHKIVFSAIKDNFLSTVGFSVLVLGWKTRLRYLFCFIGSATIVFAGSAASTASAVAACSVGLILSRNIIFKLVGCVGFFASLFFIVVYLVAPEQFPGTVEFLSGILQKPKEELLSATGRYTIWSILWTLAKDNYFGTGFGTDRFMQLIGNMDEVADRLGTKDIFVMSAHNAGLAAWLSAGWLGVVALFFVFLNGIRFSLKSGADHRVPTTMVLTFIIVNNLTIPGLGGNYSCVWLGWIAVLSILDRHGLNSTRPNQAGFSMIQTPSTPRHKASMMSPISRT